MAIVKLRPTSPGRRHATKILRDLHDGRPYAPLTENLKSNAGRNNQGRITIRHRGAGNKRLYRIIDFKRNKENIWGKVERIEYDPYRSANIALILYSDGERRYIIAPKDLTLGQKIISANDAPIESGNTMQLRYIPLGAVVHCVEMYPGRGAQLARSAGTSVQLLAREGGYATLRLRSGEMRKVPVECRATIGEVGNEEHNLVSLGKAGAKRWRGWRPHVRGVAMNPVDHPMGGGEGKTSGGRHPCSPWGLKSKGKKTRKNKRTQKYIVRSRRDKK